MIESQPAALGPAPATPSGFVRRGLALLLGSAALAGLGLGLGYSWHSFKESSERGEAMRLLKVHGYGWASELLKRIAARDDGDVEVIRELALGTSKSYFLQDAKKYLNRWCELEPAAVEPHLQRLRFWRRLGRLDEALADGETLMEIAPDDLDIQKEVILLMIQMRHYAGAERNCRRLLPQHPEDAGLRFCLAECRHADGQDEEARALLDSVLKAAPNDTDALMLRAILFCEAGQDADAVGLLRRAKKEEPFWSVPCYYLGLALARSGHAAEAEKEMAEAQRLATLDRRIQDAQLQPENLDLRVEAAKLLIERGRADEAGPLLSDVLNRRRMYDPAMRVVLGPELGKYVQGKRYR
jgi:Flp pilus assembly protein TadD